MERNEYGIAEHDEDDIHRCFCRMHKRAICHECCLDFQDVNDMAEQDAGLRAKPTPLQDLAEQAILLDRSLRALQERNDPNADFLLQDCLTNEPIIKAKLDAMRAAGEDVDAALAVQREKQYGRDAEVNAVKAAFANKNPGKNVMPYGGPETQRLFDQFASAPGPARDLDPRTCSFCSKSSATRMKICAACSKAFYCDKECQKAAWKGHKVACKRASAKAAKEKKISGLSLTWAQLEAFGEEEATGRVLEVRVLTDESLARQVFGCKDVEGVVKRVAAYTSSKRLPEGTKPGVVLEWKNPRFFTFLNGSSGARIEESDLVNVSIKA